MTGLNLETFLHLLRADLGAWVTLGLIGLVLALMAWTSWGSRRALRKCLVLSIMAHVGLALYGGTVPMLLLALNPEESDPAGPDRIREIKVEPTATTVEESPARRSDDGVGDAASVAPWDRLAGGLALADRPLSTAKSAPLPEVAIRPGERDELAVDAAEPTAMNAAPPAVEDRLKPLDATPEPTAPPAVAVARGGEDDVAPAVVARDQPPPSVAAPPAPRLRPERALSAPLAVAPTRLPALPAPLAQPKEEEVALTPRDETEPPASTAVETPALAAEPAARDAVPVDVIAARPEAPRLEAGAADLRTRTRPGAESGGMPARPKLAATLPSNPTPGPAPVSPPVDAPLVLDARPPAAAAAPTAGPTVASAETDVASAEVVKTPSRDAALPLAPEGDIRRRSRPSASSAPLALRTPSATGGLTLPRVTPSGVPALSEIQGAGGGRPLGDVPEVYRSRLDPNRSARAFRSGASPASEQAVERALDWLARHQDSDGRWDGATARYDDGTAVRGDDDYTVHCPPGEARFGECVYWEADTALTGLALLAYLGAGYTQSDGKYAETVGKGLDFLLLQQKPDGDLRGKSKAVGMYCHAMATIALCEAYALTGEERLRPPVQKAVGFLARSRAKDGLSWRYLPGASTGDTSILGWVVMALKSAREVGIEVPSTTQTGTLGWLSKVSSGRSGGLARYQPNEPVTPTMTAEAWACRQFLGVGGPGAASGEAADFLLAHGPKTDPYNLYYWYYGTLAMYQHGGDAWYRWNAQVRDEIVRRQRPIGHAVGSWDPDDSPYGAKGGRIYSTALATLTLEVYYRYLRLYDEPNIPPAMAPVRPRAGDRDPAVGRRAFQRPQTPPRLLAPLP